MAIKERFAYISKLWSKSNDKTKQKYAKLANDKNANYSNQLQIWNEYQDRLKLLQTATKLSDLTPQQDANDDDSDGEDSDGQGSDGQASDGASQ